jgi:hypothetical protein
LILFLLLLSSLELLDQNSDSKKVKRNINFSIVICVMIPLFSEMGLFIIFPLLKHTSSEIHLKTTSTHRLKEAP